MTAPLVTQRELEGLLRRLSALERRVALTEVIEKPVYAASTFTPTYNGATPGTTTYSVQTGAYVRLGSVVIATGRITWTAATGTGVAIIGGLPFTSRNTTNLRYPATLWISAVTFGGGWVEALLAGNAVAFTMYTATSNAAATQLNVEAAGDLAFTLVYFV